MCEIYTSLLNVCERKTETDDKNEGDEEGEDLVEEEEEKRIRKGGEK